MGKSIGVAWFTFPEIVGTSENRCLYFQRTIRPGRGVVQKSVSFPGKFNRAAKLKTALFPFIATYCHLLTTCYFVLLFAPFLSLKGI